MTTYQPTYQLRYLISVSYQGHQLIHHLNVYTCTRLQCACRSSPTGSGLGWLNFKNSKLLAILGSSSWLVGDILKLRLFVDSMAPSFILLVKMGEGALGKSIMSLKSLRVIFHLCLSMCVSVGWDLLYSSTRGKPLSAVGRALLLLCSSIVCLFWCFEHGC